MQLYGVLLYEDFSFDGFHNFYLFFLNLSYSFILLHLFVSGMISSMTFCQSQFNFHFSLFPLQVYHRVFHFILQFSRIFSFVPAAISANYSLFNSEMRQEQQYLQIFEIMEPFQIIFPYIFIHESIFTIFCSFFETSISAVPISSSIGKLFFVECPLLYVQYGKFFLTIGFSSLNSLEYMGFYLVVYLSSSSCFHFYSHFEYYDNFFMTTPSSTDLKIIQYSEPQG